MRRSRLSPFAVSSIDASRRIISAGALTLLAACADPMSTPPSVSEVPTVDPSVGMVASWGVVPVPSEFSWSQGQAAKLMGSAADRVCYLTYVAGDFDASTEWVGITISLGNWWLTGGSARSGVNAKARCILVSSYGAEITAISTYGSASQNVTGYACGFTRIAGRFDTFSAHVEVWPPLLSVQSSLGSYVEARVRCITSPVQTTGPVTWHGSGSLVTLASTASPWTCFLTRMRGPFEGSADWISAFKGTSVWYLWGAPHPARRAGGACVQ